MSKPPKFSPEVRECAIRMVYEVRESHASQWAAIEAVSSKIGCTAQTLNIPQILGAVRTWVFPV